MNMKYQAKDLEQIDQMTLTTNNHIQNSYFNIFRYQIRVQEYVPNII